MTNIVTLNVPRRVTAADRKQRLLRATAQDRRALEDVFWLKENAEVLNIFHSTGADLPAGGLEPFEAFYEQISGYLTFFPQYYRFILSICLDLEDLGLGGGTGARLCEWVAAQDVVQAELADLQRAEAQRLLLRRGVVHADEGLNDRLHLFLNRPLTFALPNKKAAYELTHIVFYLSRYGAKELVLEPAAMTSLTYAGLLAYLDQDADLLAEICVALRYAGQQPSRTWEDWVRQVHQDFDVIDDPQAGFADAHHEYLVTGWAMAEMGEDPFQHSMPKGNARFYPLYQKQSALRSMSQALFEMGPARRGSWGAMRDALLDEMSPYSQDIVALAEQSTDQFEPFFQDFARALPL